MKKVKILGIALQEHRDDAALFGLNAQQLRTSEILIEENFENKESAICRLKDIIEKNHELFSLTEIVDAGNRVDRFGALTLGKVTVRITDID